MSPSLLAAALKAIRNYSDTEWELFVEEWLRGLNKKYVDVKRLGASGDLGRDVVAFTDNAKLEGVWDNYQCKHLDRPLSAATAGLEIAKLVYFAFQKKFRVPRRMYFVAPRDVATTLSDLLNSPETLRTYVQAHWDSGYANHIVAKQSILLVYELADYLAKFNFSVFSYYQTSEMLNDHRQTAHWTERFGGLLPPPPKALVPAEIQAAESVYLGQLLAVYSEKSGHDIGSCAELDTNLELAQDLKLQRERFFQAESFVRHYRDETEPGTVEDFVEDIYYAIDPLVKRTYLTGYDRLNGCLAHAATVQPGGILSLHARPKTKQGVCHQLANEHRVKWISK
jgi:hypothetical protein